jgi:hypothetical protein
MRVLWWIGLAVLGCGGSVTDSGAALAGGTAGFGGAGGFAGSSGALNGGTAGFSGAGGFAGSSGASGGEAGGSCVDRTDPADCVYALPLPCEPCLTCEALPPGDSSGCEAPYDGGAVDPNKRYPLGCTEYLPWENPYYPGGPQPCSCMDLGMPDGAPNWVCPI